MELRLFLWKVFVRTGDINAYLLYKRTEKKSGNGEEKWQIQPSKVS
ncbi:MAG: YqzL family protein [Clostridia bacterium]|nr:YqzL family protein [Clostridia bacterium]